MEPKPTASIRNASGGITLDLSLPPAYITTPIYYPNAVPHIGHAYTTILCDTFHRYRKMLGLASFFLTGTDEHGQKVEAAAKMRMMSPQQHVDEISGKFERTWRDFSVHPTLFMRTTAPFHKQAVRFALQTLFDRGDIYRGEYVGWYSSVEEAFFTDKDLVAGRSPMGNTVERFTEANYFFRMSKYQEKLIEHLERHPNMIEPTSRHNEVSGFLREPLSDLCISRPKARLSWGIELPFDQDYVTYVWFDALVNYISALGYGESDPPPKTFDLYWPEAVHVIGKDIITPHGVYWLTMLLALELSLPKKILTHGWWLNSGGDKMSKSSGEVVSPIDMKEKFGADAFRYFMVREMRLGNDVPFAVERVTAVVDDELANKLGNLLSRSLTICIRNFDATIPRVDFSSAHTVELQQKVANLPDAVQAAVENFDLPTAIDQIVAVVIATNKYLELMAPWKSLKTNPKLAQEAIASSLESLRVVGILLYPVMPNKMAELLAQIGCEEPWSFKVSKEWGTLAGRRLASSVSPLFPKSM